MSWRARLGVFAALWLLVVSGLAALDALTAPPSAAPRTDQSVQRIDAGLTPGRAFVLVIDSLRYQTAVAPALMPHLTALRARSTFARITPTRDAVTVPCLRAAFTGRDRTRVFGFVENFLRGNAGLESIFTQLAAEGRSAAVYSDGSFDQFGDRGITRLSNGDPDAEGGESEDRRDHVDEQNASLPKALADYRAGKHDLVVLHVTYTDHVAHEVGIDAPLYAQRYRAADALVETLDRELPAGDTLLVMGDHGHDAQGRHAVGLDVPTYALYRGPRIAKNIDLGTVSIRDHRYLLGYALGLSLPTDFGGERHPSALVAAATGLGSYAADAHAQQVISPGVAPERYAAYGGSALLLACLFALWLQLTASRLSRSAEARGLASLARWFQPLLLALAVWGLGVVFPRVRSFVHEPKYATLVVLWLGLWAVAGSVAWRTRRMQWSVALLLLPLFVAVPTVYRYGSPPALAPAWLGLAGCVGIALFQQRLPRPPLVAAGALCALLIPFAFAESVDFRFEEWILWPPTWFPSGFLCLSLLAKIVLLVPEAVGGAATPRARWALGIGAAGLLTAAQLGAIPNLLQLIAALALLGLASIARRAAQLPSQVASVACVTGILLLHHYTVRLPVSAYYWQDCLLAALVLSARWVRPLPPPVRAQAHGLLLLLAFFVSGWVSFAWTLHRLEWRFLYDFWSAAFVESHVAAFLPLLAGRFALPLIAARVLLTRELAADSDQQSPLGLAWLLAGSKVASLMFYSFGIAFVSVASDVYLEAVQETSLACVLLLGLL